MIKYRLISVVLLGIIFLNCQSKKNLTELPSHVNTCKTVFDTLLKMNVFTSFDTFPSYPGGISNLHSKLVDNLYVEKNEYIQKSVVLELIIKENGEIISVGIKGKNNYTALEKEILKNAKALSAWNPGYCLGKPVISKIVLPLYW